MVVQRCLSLFPSPAATDAQRLHVENPVARCLVRIRLLVLSSIGLLSSVALELEPVLILLGRAGLLLARGESFLGLLACIREDQVVNLTLLGLFGGLP